MVSFHMWRQSLDKHPEPRQVTWVFGDERVLVDDVIDYVRRTLRLEPWNYVALRAGDDSERSIWSAAEQHSLDNAKRLVVVHDAEKLKDTDRFVDWLKHRTWNPQTHLLLISNEERIPKTTVTAEERKKGVKPETVPHLKAIGARGHVIECRPFTSATAKHSISWVQSKVRMPENLARHLMERSNFDLRLSRDLLLKLRALDIPPSIATINELLTQQPRDSFIDALFRIDRKEALLAAKEIQPSEYGLLIGQLDAQLDLVGMIHDLQALYQSPSEITKAAGRQAFLVPALSLVAKHYDDKRRHSIRRLLGAIDQAHRGGISDGLLEVLTANW